MNGAMQIGRHGFEALVVKGATLALLLLLLSPIVMVIAMSFTAATTLQFPPPALSFRWYDEVWMLLTGPDAEIVRFAESLVTSFEIAIAAALVCALAGIPASYALVRISFRGRGLIEELLGLPVVFPTVVLGVALLLLISQSGLDLGMGQIVVAHAIVGLPFMMRNCMASMRGIDPALQEAARTLGASSVRAFVDIVLPLSRQGIISGALLVFIISFNEFTLSYFLYTIDVFPLSIWLFQQSNTSFSPAIFAISTLTILITVGVILTVDLVAGRRR
jgi:putative spermidine/putrescine transport system permease protein